MTIYWPLVSSAVFAGGVECNPPGMGRGESGNAAALWISVEVRGLEKGCGPGWTPGPLCRNHSQREQPSEAPPRCSEKGSGSEARLAGSCGKGAGARGRTEQHRPRRAPAYWRGAPTPCWNPCVRPFSPHLSITQPPPHPCSFSLLPPAPPRMPDPFIHTPRPTSSPWSSCSRSQPWALLWLPRTPPVPGPRRSPHRTEGRGARTAHSAAQPRPFTLGRGVALTQPPALDVLLVSPA